MPQRYTQTPQEILQRLLEGNWRFRSDKLTRPNQSAAWRLEAAKEQRPMAALLGCADSRLLMETIFDCGVGDLFVCRIAGNFADDSVIGSLEFAVQELGVKLVLVVGHENCGAIKAAVDGAATVGQIDKLIAYAQPAVHAAQDQPGELLDNAVRANIRLTVEELRRADPVLGPRQKSGDIQIQGAYYHLSTGEIEMLHI